MPITFVFAHNVPPAEYMHLTQANLLLQSLGPLCTGLQLRAALLEGHLTHVGLLHQLGLSGLQVVGELLHLQDGTKGF